MNESRYLTLGDVVADELFPEVDLALRRGRHVDRDDAGWYAFLADASEQLEPFYRRYGCELVHPSEGYFYLLPTTERLGRRHLSVPEMLVGQALSLLYLDPGTLQQGGVVTRANALACLAGVMGSDALTRLFNPKRRRVDERVAEEQVRSKYADALRRLAALGFVDLLENDALRLRAALMRFAEPVKGEGSSLEALERLVARGELVLGAGDPDTSDTDAGDALEPDEHEIAEDPHAIPETVTRVLAELDDFASTPIRAGDDG